MFKKKKKVIVNGWNLSDFEYEKWYDKQYCIEAVTRNGDLLQYVKDQTPEICMLAVKEEGGALRHVRNKTKELCIAAVEQDDSALNFVDKRLFIEKEK